MGGGVSHSKAPLPLDPTMKGLDPNEWFQGGFDDAWARLFTNPKCASAIGGGKYTQVQVENQLMNEQFTAKDLGIAVGAADGSSYSYLVATTVGNLVTLNGDVFFDPTQVTGQNPDGTTTVINAVTGIANYYGLDLSKFGVADFQALYLLHELGHTLKGLLPDNGNSAQSLANNQTVIDNCFANDKK